MGGSSISQKIEQLKTQALFTEKNTGMPELTALTKPKF